MIAALPGGHPSERAPRANRHAPRGQLVNRMADPIDDLVRSWNKNPTPARTVALCDALRENPRDVLVRQVGELARQRHATDASVLLSVARMYLGTQRLAEAQTVLVAAGKQAPREGTIYRWLGEVLLRRGDAERAAKVLERAIELGAHDPDAMVWLERARTLRPMQARAGAQAVAGEVAHAGAQAEEDAFDAMATAIHRAPQRLPGDREAVAAGVPPPVPARRPAPAPAPAREMETAPEAFVPASPPPPRVARAATGSAKVGRREIRSPAPPSVQQRDVVGAAPAPPWPQSPVSSRPTNGWSPAPRQEKPPIVDEPALPHPRDVLDALALAGVFEPPLEGQAPIATWDRAAVGPKRKGGPALVVAMVLFLAASAGVYVFYKHKRAEDHLRAEALLDTVEAQLSESSPGLLRVAENELAQAFKLESRSARAALDWVRERAMVGLVTNGADVAFEDAMARARELGVPDGNYAFARVASFLFQGDTAGAAAVLPRWDGPAASDAWYQMVTGATLERAGDARARERYAAAAELDPKLLAAQIALARVTAVDGDAQAALRLAAKLRAAKPDRVEPIALVALAWGRDPHREEAPVPSEVDELAKREGELPAGLAFVPRAIAALRAIDRHAQDDARSEAQRGLAVADSPGAAVWLGTIALAMGDEGLARKAAFAALQLSGVYQPARALAARVALTAGRLDEAVKATEDLDAASPDVAIVRAAAAYEHVDADGVGRALDPLSRERRSVPFLEALALAPEVLSGRARLDAAKRVTLGADDAPWADLIAIDLTLDLADFPAADKIAAGWGKKAESQPLRALRLARLARYEGRLDDADALSLVALEGATVTARVLCERAFVLVARNRPGEVASLLSRYPLVLGPLTTWLSAYATAAGGNLDAAKGKTSSLDPPPPAAPLAAKIAVAAAFGAMKDKRRGGDYVKSLLATGSLHPDLVAAALALGFRRVDHFKRPPSFE